jgi:hypothetical protein
MALRPDSSKVGDALARSLAGQDLRALGQLADEVEAAVSRPVRAGLGPPPQLMFVDDPAPGPWLGYLLRPDGSGCWLAVGWRPPGGAAAARQSVLMDFDGSLGSARVGPLPGPWEALGAVVLSLDYQTGSLPSGHDLVNDLHAMVMLHDLLLES